MSNGHFDSDSDDGPLRLTPFTAPPLIVTERLVLRAAKRSDFDDYCAIWSNRDTVQHIAPIPFTPSQLWDKFLRGPGLWSLIGYGVWVVERQEDGRLIGEVGFSDYRRDVQPALPGPESESVLQVWPEASWLIDYDLHGKGYAGEAVAAALGWADKHLHCPLICLIAPDNQPSLRLAARNGFLVVGHRLHNDNAVLLLKRD